MEISKGLEGIYAAESAISSIDGKRGILRYWGYDINDLAKNSNFEEVCYLFLYGKLPKKNELKNFTSKLKEERKLPLQIIKIIKLAPKNSKTMAVLRTAVSALGLFDKNSDNLSKKNIIDKNIKLISQIPIIIAYFDRIRKNKPIIKPKKTLNHATNFLYMLGNKIDEEDSKIFDICLMLHAEHELNASVFSARVTASTLSDIYSAITSAVGTLKGELHGGANEKVLQMIKEIGDEKNVYGYLQKKLDSREKIMGFGHRVYRTKDPRAYILEKFSKRLSEKYNTNLYNISKKIEEFMHNQNKLTSKGIFVNVDFYSASVYSNLGISHDLFTTIFALARMPGWAAHLLEQYSDNRLIRPIAKYIGVKSRNYIPIGKRGR